MSCSWVTLKDASVINVASSEVRALVREKTRFEGVNLASLPSDPGRRRGVEPSAFRLLEGSLDLELETKVSKSPAAAA